MNLVFTDNNKIRCYFHEKKQKVIIEIFICLYLKIDTCLSPPPIDVGQTE